MRKRARGSIQRRGNSYRVRTNPKSKWLTLPPDRPHTQAAAEAYLAEKLREFDTGSTLDPRDLSVGQMLDAWFAARSSQRDDPNTDRIRAAEIGHLKAHLGAVPARLLSANHIEGMIAKLQATLGPKSIWNIVKALSAAWTWAADRKLVPLANPTKLATLPKLRKPDKKSYTPEQAARLLEALRKRGGPYGTLLLAGFLTCSRTLSMLGGLTWEDIDWGEDMWTTRCDGVGIGAPTVKPKAESPGGRMRGQHGGAAISPSVPNASTTGLGTITIGRQVYVEKERRFVPDPQNRKNRARTLPLTAGLREVLLAQKRWQEARAAGIHELDQPDYAKYVGYVWAPDPPGLVFTNWYGQPLRHSSVLRFLWDVEAECGLPRLSIHEAVRHTAVSVLISQGRTPSQIAALGGWTSVTLMLAEYAHWFAADVADAQAGLGQLLTGRSKVG